MCFPNILLQYQNKKKSQLSIFREKSGRTGRTSAKPILKLNFCSLVNPAGQRTWLEIEPPLENVSGCCAMTNCRRLIVLGKGHPIDQGHRQIIQTPDVINHYQCQHRSVLLLAKEAAICQINHQPNKFYSNLKHFSKQISSIRKKSQKFTW